MNGWHRTLRAGRGTGGLIALAAALWLGAASESGAQLVSDCVFDENDLQDLKQAISDATGTPVGQVDIPLLIVPTLNDNLGQPNANAGSEGIVICAESDIAPLGASDEDETFPSSGTADLLEIQQSSYVLIDSGSRQLRICHADEINECVVASE